VAGRLAGRVALVTGGGGGIGLATGYLFAEEGAAVALVDVDGDAAETAARTISSEVPGARVLPLGADVADESEARRVVDATVAHFGALHTLVNVAGIRVYTPLAEADAKEWERILGVNVLATAYCCKAALPHLRAAGGGTIVNVSSVYGVMGRAGMGQYDTTKAAVLGFTRALAVEEAARGIRVNAVCPGGTIRRITSAAPPSAACPSRSCASRGATTTCSAASPSRARSRTPSCSCRAANRPSSPVRR
jgi:2-hydroxycyclohexanecarboxyl-CoA dehydrogenase